MHNGRGGDYESADGDQYHRPLPDVREGVVLPAGETGGYWDGPAQPAGGQPWGLPPEAPVEAATQLIPPYQAASAAGPGPDAGFGHGAGPAPDAGFGHGAGPAPAPAGPDAEATQMFPPYPAYQPPQAPQDHATQVLRPLNAASAPIPAPLPTGPGDAATTVLRPVPGPMPTPVQQPAPYGIRPGMPGQQPPVVADATQRLPQVQDDFDHLYRQAGPPPAQSQPYQQPQPQPAPMGYQPGPAPVRTPAAGRKKLSPAAVIGIVVVGCAVAGLAAGAALSGGGSDSSNSSSQNAAATGGSPSSSASAAAADPAAEQAKKLDALLKESGNSRSSVISAVADIKACRNLGQAATDLRSAAGQRNDLVSRLGQLSVDRLPNHQALSDALNRAWKASAAADNHYAAWADQVAGAKKGCKGGQARTTGQTAAGNRESGTATQSKRTAVQLWNTIAQQYGLTKRTFTQL